MEYDCQDKRFLKIELKKINRFFLEGKMKIENANIWTIKSKVEQKSRNRYGAVDFLERTLLRLEDEKGNEGWGEMMPIIFTTEKADNATKALQTVT